MPYSPPKMPASMSTGIGPHRHHPCRRLGRLRPGASGRQYRASRWPCNFFLSNEKTLYARSREVFLAWRIEQNPLQDEISPIYPNKIPLGYRAFGGRRGPPQVYFGKGGRDLIHLDEIAIIAGLPRHLHVEPDPLPGARRVAATWPSGSHAGNRQDHPGPGMTKPPKMPVRPVFTVPKLTFERPIWRDGAPPKDGAEQFGEDATHHGAAYPQRHRQASAPPIRRCWWSSTTTPATP